MINIKYRTIDDRFPLLLREVWFFSSLGVPIPALIVPSHRCDNDFLYYSYGDHLQTCQTKSVDSQIHEWVVYKLVVLLGLVGHKVKIHKFTPATGKERDIEIKDYVVLQKTQEQTDDLSPPRNLFILDFTMTHTWYGRSIQHTTGELTHTRCSASTPQPDGALQKVTRDKIRHYRQICLDSTDPIAFMSVTVDTSSRVYDDFNRLLFLHAHHEESTLVKELPEESDQFRFLHPTCLANLQGSVGLILGEASVMRTPDFYTS